MPKFNSSTNLPIDAVDALLPQTQCTRCGYPRCREYAAAIVSGDASINRCPPGGDTVITALANLLACQVEPLDTTLGAHTPATLARIDEAACIGCALCIGACPTDAIVGTAKRMHTVITADCTGCELCAPVCPVDCILFIPAPRHQDENSIWRYYSREQAAHYRRKTQRRLIRLAKNPSTEHGIFTKNEAAALTYSGQRQKLDDSKSSQRKDAIRREIRAAVDRVRQRRPMS